MTNARTPGPWIAGHSFANNAPDYWTIATKLFKGTVTATCDNEVNARLIAAAPELLSLVKELAERLDVSNAIEAPLWNQCQNAIAKATA